MQDHKNLLTMNNIYYGMDFAKGPSQTAIVIWYGGRGHSKTFFSRLWMRWRYTDLISKQLIRRLAAEAVINISIKS